MRTKTKKTIKIEITKSTSDFMSRMLYRELHTQKKCLKDFPVVLQEDGTDKNWSKRTSAETKYDKAFLAFHQLFGRMPLGHFPSIHI